MTGRTRKLDWMMHPPREDGLSMGALRMSLKRKGLVTFDENERPSLQTIPGHRALQQPYEFEDLSQVTKLRHSIRACCWRGR